MSDDKSHNNIKYEDYNKIGEDIFGSHLEPDDLKRVGEILFKTIDETVYNGFSGDSLEDYLTIWHNMQRESDPNFSGFSSQNIESALQNTWNEKQALLTRRAFIRKAAMATGGVGLVVTCIGKLAYEMVEEGKKNAFLTEDDKRRLRGNRFKELLECKDVVPCYEACRLLFENISHTDYKMGPDILDNMMSDTIPKYFDRSLLYADQEFRSRIVAINMFNRDDDRTVYVLTRHPNEEKVFAFYRFEIKKPHSLYRSSRASILEYIVFNGEQAVDVTYAIGSIKDNITKYQYNKELNGWIVIDRKDTRNKYHNKGWKAQKQFFYLNEFFADNPNVDVHFW